jgi:putative membrane protein insertion efficiency factor
MKILSKFFTFPLILLVKIYQLLLSPLMPPVCRFQPTCSHYMIESLKVWGPLKGTYFGVKRIMRCHPWGGHGHDPVPPKLN